MKPNIPPDVRIITPEEYARRRKQREATGFADDEQARKMPLASDDENRKRKRISITIPPIAIAIAKRAGYGTISRGIEHALHYWLDANPDKRKKRAKKRVDVRHMHSGPKMKKKTRSER